ncbi:MAG: TatD family hydrolase [Patescibacteria group bacterium]
MFFDTHCHLNFGAFDGRVGEIVDRAKQAGVNQIVIPGTDIPTSEKAIAIAEEFEGVYAAVGIHPHHVFEIYNKARDRKFFDGKQQTVKNLVPSLSTLLSHPKVVAIGEVGIDRHIYQKTKYPDYKIEEEFVDLQKEFLIEQIKLVHKYKKSLIFHNREAKKDFLELLTTNYLLLTDYSSVFHCCEPDLELLEFAKKHKIFIGVDGDIFYKKDKQEFIKKVPLEMLVLETDSPFLSPDQKFGNEPKNIKIIAEFIAQLLNCSVDELAKQTTKNAEKLFNCR